MKNSNDSNLSNNIELEVNVSMMNGDFMFNTVNPGTEKFLIDFANDVISETKMGNLDWIVYYKTENNRQLRICISSDSNIKLTGIYDKGTLEKVSMYVKKSILINKNNSKLLKVLEKLIDTAETKFDCKLEVPIDFIEGVKNYYKRNNKTLPSKDFTKKKEEMSSNKEEKTDNKEFD